MKVMVKFPALPELVSTFEGKKEIRVDFAGNTVKELLHHLFLKVGAKRGSIFFDDGARISPHVLVLVNGRPIPGLNRVGKMLREDDVVELTLPLG